MPTVEGTETERTSPASGQPRRERFAAHRGLAEVYRPCDFFVVRTSLLPFRRLVDWNSRSAEFDQDASWLARRAFLIKGLKEAFAESALREATFLASAELERAVAAAGDELPEKLLRPLTRYLFRAAGREAPFGLFAGISLGTVGERDRFELDSHLEYRRHTSVAVSYLQQILSELAARSDTQDFVPHTLNPTLMRFGRHYRFASVDASDSGGAFVPGRVIEVESTPLLECAARLATNRETPKRLAQLLSKSRVPYEAARDFVQSLCEVGFFVPSWLPAVTGQSPLRAALAALATCPPAASAHALLSAVGEQLAQADSTSLGSSGTAYRAAAERLSSLTPPAGGRQALQAELYKPAPRLTISAQLCSRFLAAATLIQRTASQRRDPALADFRARFTARYEARRVPLSEALDSDLGIGFERPNTYSADSLIRDIPSGARVSETQVFDGYDRARLNLLTRALSNRQIVCELDEAALQAFPDAPLDTQAESFSVFARLAQSKGGRPLIVAPTVVAPSAISTLARFCASNPQLNEVVHRQAALERELAGDVILADVAYVPDNDGVNILVRPVLREFEIPYHGKSGAPLEQQIAIADLQVSVEAGQIVLYSSVHQRQVKVRITNAHHVGDTAHLPIYRFLGALDGDDGALSGRWSWGALDDAPFLPRVVHHDIILSLARWLLTETELEPITSLHAEAAFRSFQQLRVDRQLPRWLTRADGELRLPIDLDNELSVEELLHEARQRKSLALQELFPGHEELAVHGPEGSFAGEFVVPFVRRQASNEQVARAAQSSTQPSLATRRHAPGSSWLYAKIYAPRSALNDVLTLVRKEVVEPSLGRSAKQWFYVPYADPDDHLRIRIQGAPSQLRERVLPRLQRALEPLLNDGTVWRWQLDTYERELERYGGSSGIALAEQIFCADSDAACQLLDICGAQVELRWQYALLGLDRLLGDFDFNLEQRIAFASGVSQSYAEEAGNATETRRTVGSKFRDHTARLTALLWTPATRASGTDRQALRILARRSTRVAPLWSELCGGLKAARESPSVLELVQSFTHMHVVRLLGITARSYELVLFDFLKRLYVAQAARKEANRVPPMPSR
ncbi:MAG TPA: lantibiotic dehydratase [Polyangiaceae bacterium]|nr:lantibiotic dehydratase [Polyangiaceae bacterium]